MSEQSTYAGAERRRDQTLEGVKEMREWFENHEKEEHARYDALQVEIVQTQDLSQKRHEELVKRMDAMSQSTVAVVTKQNQTLAEIHALFKKAFPDGDAEAHRKAHEHWIEKDKKEQEFWLDIKKKVVGWAVTAAMAWGGIVLWAAFVRGPL